MKIHDRYFKVRDAALELSEALMGIIKKHDLTYAEVQSIILEQAQTWNKYAIRAERHPEDPDKKGDEA